MVELTHRETRDPGEVTDRGEELLHFGRQGVGRGHEPRRGVL
jgi:hypothetical protein